MRYFNMRFIMMLVAGIVMLPILSAEARAGKKIGVLLFSDEARYLESLQGIKDQLAKAGFKEPGVSYTMENAGGSKVRAADLVQKFAKGTFDLMITLGTNATIAAAREIRDVPIVFSMVYDPVESRVARGWKNSGNNVTGTSNMIPMTNLMAVLKEFMPAKRLGVLYTPGERNSEIQLKEILQVMARHNIRVVPVIVSSKEDVRRRLPEALPSVDALYLSGSSVIGSSISEIVELANRAKVVTVTHLEDHVESGALLGISANPYRLGSLAGKKAVRVLKGAKPSSIPIERLAKFDLLLNRKSVTAGHFTVPPGFMKKVTRVID